MNTTSNSKTKSPRAGTDRQEGTAQEPKGTAKNRRRSSIPVSADTSAWWVERLKKQYPQDYEKLARKAIEFKKRGVRLSIASLFEWARLELFEGRKGNGVAKLNNTLRPALARALMRDFPELEGAFETRRARCDDYKAESVAPH